MPGEVLIERWRESGAWWAGDFPLEFARYRDSKGVRREVSRELPFRYAPVDHSSPDYKEDHTEEIELRPRKLRDEKVALACGYGEDSSPLSLHGTTGTTPYVPLHVLSGYSFGRSVLFAREIPRRCADLGLPACALVDRFSLIGAVEFVRECKAVGIKPLLGASLELDIGGEIVLIATDKAGYVSLSQLITACHLEETRLYPLADFAKLQRFTRGLICLTGGDGGVLNHRLSRGEHPEAKDILERLITLYGHSRVFVEIERAYLPWEMSVNRRLEELAMHLGVGCVAGGRATHAKRSHFAAQDALLCSDTLCTVDEVIGRKPPRAPDQPQAPVVPARSLNGERFLRSPEEMHELFSDASHLLQNTLRLAEQCDDDVLPGRTRLPQLFPDSEQALRQITYAGATLRHSTVTRELRKRLDHELDRLCRLSFADHFLTIWDVCHWATEQNILFSGRGSVVDSAVAYCLGLSRIDAFHHKLHFDRFLPADGSKRPDIDIDFEAKRRDDVRNYMIGKYGADRVATVAAVGAYCSRGIVREVGKALGVPPDAIGYLAKKLHGAVTPDKLQAAIDARPELRDSGIDRERFAWIFRLSPILADVPRNMRAHSSGVVISDRPLAETVPVMWSGGAQDTEGEPENLRIIQWDKRSAKHYFDKFDVLCLRGQDVLSGAQERIRINSHDFNVERIPLDDEDTYRAMRSGELIGIPQSASPAMRQAHVRMKTANLHDASLVQAGIRPGVGGAVKINELIARRRGKPYSFEHPDLERILGLTYGIIVFQEQVDQLLQTFCGYTSGEAEDIREEIHKRRREDYGATIKEEMIARALDKGYNESIALHVHDLVSGFRGYGFAQGHALAFAEISLRSVYCQQNFPAEYFASLLDAQPAGYYGPCTLVNEARTRGVAVLPPDVNGSSVEFQVEDVKSEMDPKIVFPSGGLRVGLSQIASISNDLKERIVANRPYTSLGDFITRTGPNQDEFEQLVLCGALDGLCPNRRGIMWATPQLFAYAKAREGSLNLEIEEPRVRTEIEDFSIAEKAIRERQVLGLDVRRHLMAFERPRVMERGGITGSEAKRLADNTKAIVVGNPIRLRFPPTSSGKRVVFFDLEDETGLLNVTCFDDTYQRDGHAIICSPYVTLIGHAQIRDGHTAFLASRVFPYRPIITTLVDAGLDPPVATADFLVG